MNAQEKRILENSNRRIQLAIETLTSSQRGTFVLTDLREFLSNAAALDSQGLNALDVLVYEFVENHRRGF